jgi:hypothetical protein
MSPDSSRERHVYSVVPHGTTWDVKEEGRAEAVASDLDRNEAIAVARSLAEASSFGQIIVCGADGLIEYESTCGKRGGGPRRATAATV